MIKLILNRLKNIFIDSHSVAYGCPNPGFLNLIIQTTKYKLATYITCITDNEKKLKSFKNIHQGKRVFIIGNGPSLNNCDLALLKDEITFGVNSIFLNHKKMGFYPTYYVVEDVFVAEDRAKEINKYQHSIKFFGNYLKYCLNDYDNVIWLNIRFRYDNYDEFPYFSKNALRMLWTGGTVTYLCLQLAFYMGFKEVYLIGMDHHYEKPEHVEVKGNEWKSQGSDPNHFHPDYFGKGYRWHDPRVDRMEEAYRKAKQVFEEDQRKIYNATVGGKLEVFERVKYDDLF